MESFRGDNLSVENRKSLFQKWVKSYFTLSKLYIRESRYKDAFRIAEMSKARTLLESLVAKFAIEQSGLNTADKKEWDNYNKRIVALNGKIAKALVKAQIEKTLGFEADKNKLFDQLAKFKHKLRAKYPKYKQLSTV